MAVNKSPFKSKSATKVKFDEDFQEQINEVNPAADNMDIGEEYLPPLDVAVPALIQDIKKINIGYCVDTAIFADEVYNHGFIYKDGTSAISQLRRFAGMFESFSGNLASIVGKCALIKLKQTDYGMLYMIGIEEITREEADRMFKEIKEACLKDDELYEEDEEYEYVDDEEDEE